MGPAKIVPAKDRGRRTGDDTVEEKDGMHIQKKQYPFIAGVLFLAVCSLLFLNFQKEGEQSKTAPAADFFAYTDTENRLYLWREGSDEPLLLTDHAFALEGQTQEVPYWKAWEYWEEWEEENEIQIRNEEKALQDVVWELPDQRLLFPRDMRWTAFGVQRGAKEQEEALAYTSGEELEEWVKVRAFCYDLYVQPSDTAQEAEKIAENVLFYSVDQKGAVWYGQASVDGTVKVRGEELPCTRCMLYRYDGIDHQKIGEINGRKKEPYRVQNDGDLVIFYGMDDRLYGCRPKKEPRLLAEGVDTVLCRDDNKANLLYIRDGSVYRISGGKEETEVYTGEEDNQLIGALGKEGKFLFVIEAQEHVRYSDWIARDGEETDADTEKLWELLEQTESKYYPLLCTVRVLDLAASPVRTVEETKGYVLMASLADKKGNPKDVYYMEMIPANSFEKIPLSELLGDSLPGDVLYAYSYYLDNYGENYAEQAFAWGLEACWEREALEKRTTVYGVTKKGIHPLEELEEGIVLSTSKDYSWDGTHLYLMQYQSPDMENDYRKYGHHVYFGYLENRYQLDGDGSCQKKVELADETRVVGDDIFYIRKMGLEGYVNLYKSSQEKLLASAAKISLDSIQKSEESEAFLFLAEGLRQEAEETIPVRAEADLRAAYRELGMERDRFFGEENLHTLVLCQKDMMQELEQNISYYAFYGKDSVWMLQYEEKETPESEDRGRIQSLYVWENNEKRKITDQAVWIIKAGSGEGSRSASWVFE